MEDVSLTEVKNTHRQVRFIFIGVLIILSCALLITIYTQLRLHPIPLTDQKTGRGLITVENLDQKNPSLSFYRLRDAQVQVVTGTFRYVFTQPHEALVYGYTPDKPREQHLFILDDEKIRIKNINKLPGIITQLNASPNLLYLLVSGINSTSQQPYVCVVGRTLENFESCRLITSITSSTIPLQAFWNSSKNAELVIGESTTSSPHTWLYYPSSQKLELSTTTPPGPTENIPPLLYTLHRIGPLVIATEQITHRRHIFLTSALQLLQLANGLLVGLTDQQSFIIDPDRRTISNFAPLPPRETRAVSVY